MFLVSNSEILFVLFGSWIVVPTTELVKIGENRHSASHQACIIHILWGVDAFFIREILNKELFDVESDRQDDEMH